MKFKKLLSFIKCIFFDFGGTLYESKSSLEDITYNFLKENKLGQVSYKSLAIAFKKANKYYREEMLPRVINESQGAGKFTRKDWVEYDHRVLSLLGYSDTELAEKLQDKMEAYFSSPGKKHTLIQGTKAVLNQLVDKGYIIGLISNTTHDLTEELKSDGILHIFKTLVFSYQVNSWKPDPRIFHIATNQLNIKNKQCAHIGNSVEEDIQGAINASVTPIYLRRKNDIIAEISPPPPNVITISKIEELLMYTDTLA